MVDVKSLPNPMWKPGQKIQSPVQEMQTFDLSQLDLTSAYKLMIGSIVPRPIALMSTQNRAGQLNLAPFSYFMAVSSRPPCIAVSLTRKADGGKKDSLLNIEETGQFVVNTVSEWMAEPMNYCSGEFDFGISEFEKSGLTPIPSIKVKPPRVKEAAIQMECELFQKHEIGNPEIGASTLIIGKIIQMHVSKSVLDPTGKIEIASLAPLSRLAGLSYGRTSGIFDLPRPKV